MLLITASSAWKTAYPGTLIGLLEVADVDHKSSAPALDAHKRVIEDNLRQCYREFTRAELVKLPVMAAYVRYYKRFSKTYHILLQLESVVLKGKRLPSVSPLVDANFCAELATLVLTAGEPQGRLAETIAHLVPKGRSPQAAFDRLVEVGVTEFPEHGIESLPFIYRVYIVPQAFARSPPLTRGEASPSLFSVVTDGYPERRRDME